VSGQARETKVLPPGEEGRAVEIVGQDQEHLLPVDVPASEMTVLDEVGSDFRLTLVSNLRELSDDARVKNGLSIGLPSLVFVSIFVFKK
jgi:hypothetical protein